MKMLNSFQNKYQKLQAFYYQNLKKINDYVSYGVLLLAIIIGAGYRVADVKSNFGINGGFMFHVNTASHFWSQPGAHNYRDVIKDSKSPDTYKFTRNPERQATGAFENEKGWAFILSLIFKEGEIGINNLANTVIFYQIILDLCIIVILFFAGRIMAGAIGGNMAAIAYALFEPSIRHASWVSYYYWAIPFSALSILFWVVIYRPERKTYSLMRTSFFFFLYGIIIGFATFVRISFLYLPLFMIPIIFFREGFFIFLKNMLKFPLGIFSNNQFKRSLCLSLALLIGQAVLLLPQCLITCKLTGGHFTLSERNMWSNVITGLGAYPNPWGIPDTGEINTNKWGIRNGLPDLGIVGPYVWDQAMKKKALELIKERPDVFLRNSLKNCYYGFTMFRIGGVRYWTGDTYFCGLKDSKILNIQYFYKVYLFLVIIGMLGLYVFYRKNFGPFIAVLWQGIYIIATLCLYFPPIDAHLTAYFPVAVLLFAIGISVIMKLVVKLLTIVVLKCKLFFDPVLSKI